MQIKEMIKQFIPPFLLDLMRKIYRGAKIADFEYVPSGWDTKQTNPLIKGWDIDSVLSVYKSKWPQFKANLTENGPLGISHEANKIINTDLASHNTVMSFAYVLALAARNKDRISVLDWGGGIGHYYLISQSVLPNVKIDYNIKDVPALCEYGRTILPEVNFYNSDSDYSDKRFDLVMASGSLQYVKNWQEVLQILISVASGYLYITRLPMVFDSPSYVVVQRGYKWGHDNEYLLWVLNRKSFLDAVGESAKMKLVREFIIGEKYNVLNAPAPIEVRGFLFKVEGCHENRASL